MNAKRQVLWYGGVVALAVADIEVPEIVLAHTTPSVEHSSARRGNHKERGGDRRRLTAVGTGKNEPAP